MSAATTAPVVRRVAPAAALRAQIASESLKLRSVRSTAAVAAGAVALECLFKVVSVLLLEPGVATGAEVVFALRPSISYPALVAVLGVLLAGAEWRYGTASPTYAVQPRRAVVLAAKAVVAAVAGLLTGAVATVLAGAAAVLLAGRNGLPLPAAGTIAGIAVGSVLAAGLLAVLGVVVGTLLRNQVAAVAVTSALLFVLPPLAILLSPAVYAWTPSGGVDALAVQQAPNPDLLTPLGGAALLVTYAVAGLVAAARVVRRRPVG